MVSEKRRQGGPVARRDPGKQGRLGRVLAHVCGSHRLGVSYFAVQHLAPPIPVQRAFCQCPNLGMALRM